MDPDPTASTGEDQITSTKNSEPEHDKDTSTSNQTIPKAVSTAECDCKTELVQDSPEPEAHGAQGLWSSQDDSDMDRELNPREADIRQFMEDFKDFHGLMIQLNEAQYYGTQMDTIHTSIETDLLDLLGELAYRRAEEAEELRQKTELEEILKSVNDDSDNEDKRFRTVSQTYAVGQTDAVGEDDDAENVRVVMEVLDNLINMVVERSDYNKNNHQ